jgi:CheY-like chemotaxis protein
MTKKKIMIVDDVQSMLQLTKMALEDPGWEISTALSGVECLNMVKKEKPDLVLLDIMMPKMSGYDVCSAIKSDGRLKNIFVAYYSALSRADIEPEMKKTMADDYVQKGLSFEELREKVHLILNRNKE